MAAETATVTERLAGLLARPVEPDDRRRAARHLLDWYANAAIGRVSEPGMLLAAETRVSGGDGPVRMFAGRSLDPASAAFLGGGLGSILEMDDVHRGALLHPGPAVIPAVLAAAGSLSVHPGGEAILSAVVRGYEAMIRLGRSVGPGHYARFHNTGTCGAFGAAAAVASLLNLSTDATADALGSAATAGAGLWAVRHEPVPTKTLHVANAARAGFTAARLAARGFAGPRRVLEGPQGFFAGLCPDGDPERVVADRAGLWLIGETSFKPWPACRHAHPAIDAALVLAGRIDGAPLRSVRVETYADAVRFCDRPTPTTTAEAKFSLQHAVAVVFADGPPPLSAFDSPALSRPDLVRLREITVVADDGAFTAVYPGHFGARVHVDLGDGRRLTAEVADALGDPEQPLDDAALAAKAHALFAAAGVARAVAGRIVDDLLSVADPQDLLAPLHLLDCFPDA
jgi:2-methylcitrate dehydratase PrpD